MSVLVETTIGNISVDLDYKLHELACFHFIQLCKSDAYFFLPFHGLIKDVRVLLGNNNNKNQSEMGSIPSRDTNHIPHDLPIKYNTSKGISGHLKIDPSTDLVSSTLPIGTISFTTTSIDQSEIVIDQELSITMGEQPEEQQQQQQQQHSNLLSTSSLVPFGKITEGFAVLEQINQAKTNITGDFSQDIRIRSTVVLHDPFPGLQVSVKTRYLSDSQLKTAKLPIKMTSESEISTKTPTNAEINSLTLEMLGDIPVHNFTPSPQTLFIAKLNPITEEDLLQIVFGRFGTVIHTKIVRDDKKRSMGYGFVEFNSEQEAENAYFSLTKGCVIDGRQVAVDFSQSSFRVKESRRA